MRESTPRLRERTPAAVHASRAAGWLRSKTRGFAVALAIGALLAVVGAFGTGEEPFGPRLVYWLTLMLAGAFIGALVQDGLGERRWLEQRPWLRVGVVSLIIAVLLTGLVWAFTWAFFGRGAGFAGPLYFFLPVLAVSAVVTAVSALGDRQPAVTHQAAAGAPPARFLDRLPPKLRGGELFAVEAEDHYLRLHTSRGSDLVLMRLADAVAELEGLEGAQTHRSWWVAKSAVEDVRRGDGRAVLRLKNGVEAPVSRTYAKALRDSGWF